MTVPGVVVVGVDGSEVAKQALVFAASEAELRGCRLIVAHACPPAEPDAVPTEVLPFADIVRKEVVATLAAVQPRLDYRIEQRDADPAALLLELGAAADLLVIGTHRSGRLRGFVLGSVSQRVTTQTTGTVVAISGAPERDDGPVVLGASSTPGGLAAMRFAFGEARLRGAAVRAIRCVTFEDWIRYSRGGHVAFGPDGVRDAAAAELDSMLREARAEYPDVSVEAAVCEANAFATLLQASQEASMLVVGSRRGPQSLLPRLGPVSAWLLHQTSCPLVLVGHAEGELPS